MRPQTALFERVFVADAAREERVGIELEFGLVDGATAVGVPYEGPCGGRAILDAIAADLGGRPVLVGGDLVGVDLPNGAAFTLETGGALEYASPPRAGLAECVRISREQVLRAAAVAARFGVVVLSGGLVPFTPVARIPWNPKPRVRVMLDYFRALGDAGRHAAPVMGLTLSTQTSLDYTSTADLLEKADLNVRIAPVLAALFVNSPIADGVDTGVLSRRMQYWEAFDPRRCGVLDVALGPAATVPGLAGWAARLPMIYRERNGTHVAAPDVPFERLLVDGFGDGTVPTDDDWDLHLSQVWPQVRVRRTLELRAPDAPPWAAFGAVAAMGVGLTYHAPSRRKAIDLLGDVTADDLRRANADVAVKGLAASLGPFPVHDLARELVRLARAGLEERVRANLEPADVVELLEPVEEIAETGETFADRIRTRWAGDPGRYLAEYRVG